MDTSTLEKSNTKQRTSVEMKVILRWLDPNNWARQNKYPNCFEDICPYMLRNGRRYNPFMSDDEELRKIKEKLADRIHTNLDDESPFWDTFFIRMRDEDLILYPFPGTPNYDPYDELKYYYLRNHYQVKNSLSERKPEAKWVLIDETAEAKVINEANRLRRDMLFLVNKMTLDDMRDALRLYGMNPDIVSNEVVEQKLVEQIEKNPGTFKMIWLDNKQRKTNVLVEKAISKGLIRSVKKHYLYGTDDMGTTIKSVIDYLENEDNNATRLAILKQVE